jgi:hypothetical protein
MMDKIRTNLDKPEVLENLYRSDRKSFKAAFDTIFPDIAGTDSAKFWRARLDYDSKPDILRSVTFSEIVIVAAICLLTAFLVKIPALFSLGYSEEDFYLKNASIIGFFALTLYTMIISKIRESRKIILTALGFLLPVIYVNFLPSGLTSDSVTLVFIHLPLLMWFIYGIVFTGFDFRNKNKRIDFIKYMGDLAIVFALIAIAGGLLTGITIGLFSSIGLNIEKLYFQNIVLSGVFAAPVVATYIIEKFPSLVSRTAPIIAGIFSPLVLITLIVFLVTIMVTGKDPYNDRNFLLIFNVMLLGVMAIIIFSVSETAGIRFQKFNSMILFALSIITIIIDLIALSAIFYRLGEFGLTPNRLAVFVSNVLVLVNLILIMTDLYRINFKGRQFSTVENRVSGYLPVYLGWIFIVVVSFPLIFGI